MSFTWLQDENEEEEDLLDQLCGALTSILREYGDTAMPLVDSIMLQIGQLLDPSRAPGERRIGISIIDDLLEHSAAGAASRRRSCFWCGGRRRERGATMKAAILLIS